jgi:hypothetical protein
MRLGGTSIASSDSCSRVPALQAACSSHPRSHATSASTVTSRRARSTRRPGPRSIGRASGAGAADGPGETHDAAMHAAHADAASVCHVMVLGAPSGRMRMDSVRGSSALGPLGVEPTPVRRAARPDPK